MKRLFPVARIAGIVVQELTDEILICDLANNQVFCLNQTAAEVWKLSDGKHSVNEISKTLSKKLNTPINEEMVLFSLDELSKNNLLIRNISGNEIFNGISRREVIRRVGLGTMAAIPLISSVVMPRAIQAASSCATDTDCGSGNCCDTTNNTCSTSGSDGCVCSDSFGCNSSCCTTNTGVCSQSPTATCGGGIDCPAPYICCVNPITGAADSNCSCDGLC